MQHEEYWSRRFNQLLETQLEKSDEYYSNIQEQYRKAIENIEKDIARWYMRYAEKNKITFQEARKLLQKGELAEFKLTVEEYIAKGESLDPAWKQQLESASVRVHVSRLEALKLQMQHQAELALQGQAEGLSQLAQEIYTDTYYKTAFEIQKGLGVGFDFAQLDTNLVNKLLSKPWAADGKNFSERIWSNKTQLTNELENSLAQSIIRGQSPQKLITDISKRFEVSKYKAGRLIMTESAFFASASQRDCFTELGVEKYEIVSTLDNRTSETCRNMDGKVLDMKDYRPGATAPPFHANCRSTTVPYFDDEFTLKDKRAARDEDGQYYTVPADMKYEDWEKVFVNGGSKAALTVYASGGRIIKKKVTGALNANSLKAHQHAKQFYREIRKRTTDCKKIAIRTGLGEEYVREVKEHLFIKKHDLGDGVPRHFYPDYEISQSWQRLTDDNMKIQEHDIILLYHEHLEAEYMAQGMSQAEAHKKANLKYDYSKALIERK